MDQLADRRSDGAEAGLDALLAPGLDPLFALPARIGVESAWYGHLPFARGIGIAQYTSDPVFRGLVQERLARPRSGPAPKVTPQALRTLVEITRNAPGPFWGNLRSPVPRAAVETFLQVYSRPRLSWDDLAGLRLKPVPVSPGLLAYLDRATRARLLARWNRALAGH